MARFLSPFAGDLFPSVANLVAIFLRQAFPQPFFLQALTGLE